MLQNSPKIISMIYINRSIESVLAQSLARGKSVLLLGARQTGKTTLINRLPVALSISLIQPQVRQRYERNPALLQGEVEALAEQQPFPLIVIDEVQKVPDLLDVVQDLIDRKIAKFVLSGSSARKLRMGSKINLLPGRVVVLRLDPLTVVELKETVPTLPDLLCYGTLPGILNVGLPQDKEIDLQAYVSTYLEEEVRAEALVRNVGIFSQFLKLAASESGEAVNFQKLSQEMGIARNTITAYYQILEDCLIAERIDPFTEGKTRRRLMKASKYIFFDLGVRRVCAEEGVQPPEKEWGKWFEQWVGLELVRLGRIASPSIKVHFWRDANGPEVDWVAVKENTLIPIEVKWTEAPNASDIKHLKLFKAEYENAPIAYVVCRTPLRSKLAEGIYAIPWQELDTVF